jgi:hypothetical protein
MIADALACARRLGWIDIIRQPSLLSVGLLLTELRRIGHDNGAHFRVAHERFGVMLSHSRQVAV